MNGLLLTRAERRLDIEDINSCISRAFEKTRSSAGMAESVRDAYQRAGLFPCLPGSEFMAQNAHRMRWFICFHDIIMFELLFFVDRISCHFAFL